MKYIDAEKLISELRKHLIPTVVDRDYDEWEQGKDAGLLQAIDIVESLQQEQPEVDLNDYRIADIIQNLFPTNQFIESESLLLDKEEAILFARHFAEWGAIHLNARKEG